MTAILFQLHRLDTGRRTGFGLVCVDARYASVALEGVGHLLRRFATPAIWREVAHEISMGLNPGPLPAEAHLAQLLAGEASRSIVVQWVTATVVDAAPEGVTERLDATLKAADVPIADERRHDEGQVRTP